MKKTIKNTLLAIIFTMAFLLSSCIDERYDFESLDTSIGVDMALVGPIGSSKIVLSTVLPESVEGLGLLVEDEKIYIVMYDTVDFGSTFIDDIKVPKGQYTKHIPVIDSDLLPTNNVNVDVNVEYEFDINTNPNERIDTIIFNNDTHLAFSFSSTYDYTSNAKMEIIFNPNEVILNPALYPNNKVEIMLQTGTIVTDIDFSGAKFYFPNSSKKINIRYKANVETNTPFVPGTSPIDVDLDFEAAIPRIVYGYIGQDRDIWGGEIVRDFDFTSLFQGVDFFLPFYNPEIYITAQSNIGIPAQYTLDWVKAKDKTTNEVVSADFEGSPSTSFVLNYPVYSEIEGKSLTQLLSMDTRLLDKEHTKLFDREYGATNRLFQINANELSYKFSVRTVADPTAPVHYFFNDSKMSLFIQAKMELNFEGNNDPAKSFFVQSQDTLGFVFSDYIDTEFLDNVDEVVAKIKLDYKNALPIGANATIRFLDENNQEVEYNGSYLRKEYDIVPAQVKNDGSVLNPLPNKSMIISFTGDDVKNYLKHTKKLAFDYTVKGNDTKNILIQASDWLEVKASFYTSVKAKVVE
jgi:hypothetical protein